MYIGLFCCNAKYVDNYALQTKVASYTKTRGLMKSARIISPGRFEVFDEKTPSPGDGKLLVRLLRAAICGSDLPYFSRSFDSTKYPFPPGYPGHECMGVVEESHNGSFKPGDRVMYYPTFLEGYREYHLADPSRLQKLPRDFDMNLLVMTQLLGAVAHCAFRIDRPYNRTVAIMGQGPVGLLFTSLMKNFGARRVIAVDPLEYRLGVARRMGADHTVNPEREDLTAAVSEMTDGAMADIVIEAYGQDVQVINACFDIARPQRPGGVLRHLPGRKAGAQFQRLFPQGTADGGLGGARPLRRLPVRTRHDHKEDHRRFTHRHPLAPLRGHPEGVRDCGEPGGRRRQGDSGVLRTHR